MAGERLVPDEGLLIVLENDPAFGVGAIVDSGPARPPGGSRPRALHLERSFEALDIDGVSTLLGHELREVEGEAEGVIELEGLVTRDRVPLTFRELVESGHPAFDRRQEALLFGARRVEQVISARDEVGVRSPHLVDHSVDDAHQRRLAAPEQPRVADGSPKDATEDIASPFVRRKDAVGEQEPYGPGVVGQDAVAHRTLGRRGVGASHHLFDPLEERLEEVGVVVRVGLLQDGGDPLQPRAGIDAWRGKRMQRSFRVPIELHEDQVPELDDLPRLVQLDEFLGARHRRAIHAQIVVHL